MSLRRAIRASLIAGFALGPSLPAMADIQWNGFMTVAAGMTLDEEETYNGYDSGLSFEPDTVLGLQAYSDLGNNFSATVQLVGRSHAKDIEAEWAYVSYQATPDLRFNLGRQRLPLYFYSDYLDVGYAYHFLSPPSSVYNVDITSVDGISALYSKYVGDFEFTGQLIAGISELNPDSGDEPNIGVEDHLGGVLTVSYDDWLTFRASYHKSRLTISGDPAGAYMQGRQLYYNTALSVGDDAVARAFSGKPGYTFGGLGISADLNDFVLVAEATLTDIDRIEDEQKGFYISAGKRFGSVMPYVIFERREATSNLEASSPYTAPIVEGYAALTDYDQRSYSAGVRYDFHPAAALKVEYTKVDDQRSIIPAGTSSRDASAIRLAVDTVF